ncbi:MAG TPA: NAD-dependent epimerase/dehydratase family protein [Thermodesulfobacteriota bacterium]|nr:NAD-dependent epimerase/dehydratase family protein [Thermodesulfobacteriota bacterium]
MRILVTGGAGFIGSHVVDAYINAGHEVTVVDDLSTGKPENINPKARFLKLDIGAGELRDLFKDGKFDAVNHHAAQMNVRKSVADPILDARINIIGTLNLLDNCVRGRVKGFIFASTGGAIYGEQKEFPAKESHPTNPLSPYGIAKLACEHYLSFYKNTHGLNSTILRYANVYGPRQDPHGEAGVVAIFTRKLLKGEQPLINGDGMQTRDFVYVGDVVRANCLALSHNDGGVFNIGTGREVHIKKLFKELVNIVGVNVGEGYGPPKSGEQKRSVIDFEKAKKEFGWSPQVFLEEGLRHTVDYFKEAG